ncbi:MAG: DNA internalization-related competence protein ComEC/Rec2 [Proteobacteria bacterium]|nr:DNA internalization-related competence protein ComEC/Rec2 [Pseudomonadota bacterium]
MLAATDTKCHALANTLSAIWANYRCWWVVLVITGFYVAAAWHHAQAGIIPECAAGVDLGIDVQVLAAAREDSGFWTLDLLVLPSQPEQRRQQAQPPVAESCPSLAGKRLRLRWLSVADIQVRQTLALKAKLRQPWGAANPGGFDYQRWLLASGYSATGYVREGVIRTTPSHLPLRYRWVNQVHSLLQVRGLVRADILLALVTGDSNAVDAATWERHRRAGTIHLLVVSGLHVSVFALLLFGLMHLPLRLVCIGKSRLYAELRSASAVCVAAVVLAWLTGAGSPVVRVAGMLVCLLVLRLLRRRVSIWQVLLLVLIGTIWLMPLQVLHSGFWLSFGAVAVLLGFFYPRRPRAGSVASLLQVQGVLWLGLSPLLVLLLGEVAVGSMLANLLTVPIVTLVTVPALFIGTALAFLGGSLSHGASDGLLHAADFSLVLVDVLLNMLLDQMPARSATVGYVPIATGFAALLAGFVVLLPLSVYARLGAALAVLTLTLQAPADVQPGQFCIRVVDVGQGSAAIVDTASHRLLVDTGPRFGRSDWARSHVLPVLRSTGSHNIDQLLLSHNDADHAGGVDFFRDYFAALPFTGPDTCLHQKSWLWDGVRFTTLQARGLRTDNDRSCTLLVQTATQAAYLSGDISAQAERLLLNDLPPEITFLLSPHHGSATSSSIGFVRYLSPKIVVHSCGRRNRYGHPHPTVLRRYIWEQSQQINTAASGAVQWCSSAPLQVKTQRS